MNTMMQPGVEVEKMQICEWTLKNDCHLGAIERWEIGLWMSLCQTRLVVVLSK